MFCNGCSFAELCTKQVDQTLLRWHVSHTFAVVLGENQLGLETDCAWATPGSWTELNVPCNEDGANC